MPFEYEIDARTTKNLDLISLNEKYMLFVIWAKWPFDTRVGVMIGEK